MLQIGSRPDLQAVPDSSIPLLPAPLPRGSLNIPGTRPTWRGSRAAPAPAACPLPTAAWWWPRRSGRRRRRSRGRPPQSSILEQLETGGRKAGQVWSSGEGRWDALQSEAPWRRGVCVHSTIHAERKHPASQARSACPVPLPLPHAAPASAWLSAATASQPALPSRARRRASSASSWLTSPTAYSKRSVASGRAPRHSAAVDAIRFLMAVLPGLPGRPCRCSSTQGEV